MKITIGLAEKRIDAMNKSPNRKEKYDDALKEMDSYTKNKNKIKKPKVDKTLIDFLNEKDKLGKCVKCEKKHESVCPKDANKKDGADVKEIDVRV